MILPKRYTPKARAMWTNGVIELLWGRTLIHTPRLTAVRDLSSSHSSKMPIATQRTTAFRGIRMPSAKLGRISKGGIAKRSELERTTAAGSLVAEEEST